MDKSVTWKANTEPYLTGYRVYCGTSSGVYTITAYLGLVTTYTKTSLPNDTQYYCMITSLNLIGAESDRATEISVATDGIAPGISISSPSIASTTGTPVTYTVTYNGADAVILANGNITLNKTGTANGALSVSGTGNITRTVTINSITGIGTLGLSIGAGSASDIAGNSAGAAGPSATFSVEPCQPVIWYQDADNDGYSDGTTTSACTRPAGYKLSSELTAISGDPNDADPAVTGALCMDMNLTEGWNLISLPVSPAVNAVTTLFPDAIAVYGFNGVYQITTNMETGKGYWIKVPSTKTYTICGQDYTNITVTLEDGWHLMGAVNGNSIPIAIPSGCITAVYGFNGAFYVPNQHRMESGNGYWVKSNGTCGFELRK